MPELVFYRQKRHDGGIRTGIELDEQTIAHVFEAGDEESDPVLLWYVDLRCSGEELPDEPEAVVRWLVENSGPIREGFARFADKLRVGADPDLYPLQWNEFAPLPNAETAAIVCSTSHRVEARGMAEIVGGIGDHWLPLIHWLESRQEVGEPR